MSDSPLAIANQVDQVKAFMLFCFAGGDVDKTAALCQVDVRIIQALAHDFLWLDKIIGQNRLDTPEGLKAEQEANRARCYTMAQRYGKMLENVILDHEHSDRFAETMCVELVPIKGQPGQFKKVFTGKPLLELAKAMQVVSDMSYRALGDKVAAKADTNPDGGQRAQNLAINIYQGLQKLGASVKQADRSTPTADIAERVHDAMDTALGVVIDDGATKP